MCSEDRENEADEALIQKGSKTLIYYLFVVRATKQEHITGGFISYYNL